MSSKFKLSRSIAGQLQSILNVSTGISSAFVSQRRNYRYKAIPSHNMTSQKYRDPKGDPIGGYLR